MTIGMSSLGGVQELQSEELSDPEHRDHYEQDHHTASPVRVVAIHVHLLEGHRDHVVVFKLGLLRHRASDALHRVGVGRNKTTTSEESTHPSA